MGQNYMTKYYRMMQTRELYFLVLEAASSGAGGGLAGFLPRPLSLACRWPPSPHMVFAPRVRIASAYKSTGETGRGPTPVTSL